MRLARCRIVHNPILPARLAQVKLPSESEVCESTFGKCIGVKKRIRSEFDRNIFQSSAEMIVVIGEKLMEDNLNIRDVFLIATFFSLMTECKAVRLNPYKAGTSGFDPGIVRYSIL